MYGISRKKLVNRDDDMNYDAYQNIARYYDRIIEPTNKTVRQIGFKISQAEPGMRTLDIGCGTGSNLYLYQMAGCEVHGIDQSPAMLKVARRKLTKNAHLHRGDAVRLPYAQSTFDLVSAMLILHEIPGEIRSQVLREMARVLKPDGHILLIDFHPGLLHFPKGWIYKCVTYFFELSAGQNHFRNYRHFLRQGGILGLLGEVKFKIEKRKIISGGNMALFLLSSS